MKNNKPKFIATFLLASFVIGTSASAQLNPFKRIKQNQETSNSYKKAQQFLKVQQFKSQNKPTTIHQRVLSQAAYDGGTVAGDSVTYTYSDMRGSDFDYYNLDFEYNTNHENGVMPIESASILSANKITALADTINHYYDNNNGQFNFSVGYYRADNQLDSIITGTGDNNNNLSASNIIENTFNTSNLFETTIRRSIGNSTDYTITKYYYNASFTKIIVDSTFDVSSGTTELDWITSYKYDANDRIDSIITLANPTNTNTIMVDFTAFSYYPNGKVQSINYYELGQSSISLDLIESDSFSYFSNFDAYESIKLYSYDEGQLYSKVIGQGTLGANGYPDSLKALVIDYDSNDSFDVAVVYQYNSFNNPITINQYTYGNLEEGTRFHYEVYDDSTTSIKSVSNRAFEVFPNPIKNQININNKSEFTGMYSISLMDIAGRTIFNRQQNIHAGQNQISIPQISKGTYFLELKNDKGVQFSQKVVKE